MPKFKIFLISVIALVAMLGGYLFVKGDLSLWGSFRNQTGTILDKFSSSAQSDSDSQSSEENKAFTLSSRRVVSLTNSLNKDGVLYYEQGTGKVLEYDLATKAENIISDKLLPNFISTIWSPTKKDVVSAFLSQNGYDFGYFNFATNRSSKLNKDIRSVAFSPDGNYIVYFSTEEIPASESELPENEPSPSPTIMGQVIISQPDGSVPKTLLKTRIEDMTLSWPARDRIIIATPKSGVFSLTETGKLEKILEPLAVLEENWSKTGQKMLYSGLTNPEGQEPLLSVINADSREDKFLDIQGSASKCAWSLDDVSIYCALNNSPSTDDIYLINTVDSSKKLVASLPILVKEMLLSSTEKYIFYISSDDRLYALRLP